jgi:iron complex outermembrane receptor protein
MGFAGISWACATTCRSFSAGAFCYSRRKSRTIGEMPAITKEITMQSKLFPVTLFVLSPLSLAVQSAAAQQTVEPVGTELDKVIVSSRTELPDTHISAPTSEISAEELKAINFTNVEDAVVSEPAVTVRKRYIGDPNGTLGIRSANMFQTTRSMVFADGLPLHYFLQSQWGGAPRWSVVAPNEVDNVEVVYGPFSAQYAGNAMGGVVNIETRKPAEREITIEGAMFMQQAERIDGDQDLFGNRLFTSYSERFGNLGLFASYNRLQNEGQPQSIYAVNETTAATLMGGERGKSASGADILNVADSGVVDTRTDLYKLKADYQAGAYELRGTLAYEVRQNDTTDTQSYAKNADGSTYYTGRLKHTKQDRESLLTGLGITGPLASGFAGDWNFSADLSKFDILKDERIDSGRHPDDPAYSGVGALREYKDTGWLTLDAKAGTQNLFQRDDMTLITGLHYDHYKMQINDDKSFSYQDKKEGDNKPSAGGETKTKALFLQYGWQFIDGWDLQLGGRYEEWDALNAFKGVNDEGDKIDHPDRDDSAFSPKFSLGWNFAPGWNTRYSLAKAVRFPIVEELYNNESTENVQTVADADLSPEVGIHHNLSFNKLIDNGEVSLNIFYEEVEDTIFKHRANFFDNTGNQVELNTFLNVDRVHTKGAELSYNQRQFLIDSLDLRYNISYIDATIARNDGAPETEGKYFPRIPEWKNNLTLTHHTTQNLDLSVNVRHASDAFNTLDNSDKEDNVFGSIDAFTFVNLKANYKVNKQAHIGLGVDNLTDEEVYVHHPYPRRTLFLEGGYTF